MIVMMNHELEGSGQTLAREEKDRRDRTDIVRFSALQERFKLKYIPERISFFGHGNEEDGRVKYFGSASTQLTAPAFSGLTPEQFVDQLVRSGLPKKVKTIELWGCGIGDKVINGDGTTYSYAGRVAALLAQKGYDKLRVLATSGATIWPEPTAQADQFVRATVLDHVCTREGKTVGWKIFAIPLARCSPAFQGRQELMNVCRTRIRSLHKEYLILLELQSIEQSLEAAAMLAKASVRSYESARTVVERIYGKADVTALITQFEVINKLYAKLPQSKPELVTATDRLAELLHLFHEKHAGSREDANLQAICSFFQEKQAQEQLKLNKVALMKQLSAQRYRSLDEALQYSRGSFDRDWDITEAQREHKIYCRALPMSLELVQNEFARERRLIGIYDQDCMEADYISIAEFKDIHAYLASNKDCDFTCRQPIPAQTVPVAPLPLVTTAVQQPVVPSSPMDDDRETRRLR